MNEKDWKLLYEELLRQQESEQAANQELEELLARTITRLTLAAAGLDSRLDPHLKGVRDAVRSGVNHQLKEKLSALSDGLLRFGDDSPDQTSTPTVDFPRLLEPLRLGKKETREAEALLHQLVETPAEIRLEQLQRLAGLLGQRTETREKRLGLFERLLGSPSEDKDRDPRPNDILLNLLEQASWPGHWGGEISNLKARLGAHAPADAWTGVLSDLLALSAKSFGEVQMEIKETEDFLEELTKRLQDLGMHLQSAHAGRDVILKHGQDLSSQVNGHVGELGVSVAQATDLQQLKNSVSERLSLIKQNIDAYIQEEMEWHEKTASSEKALQGRLEKLERESSELRSRMVEAHHLALLDTVTGLPNRLAYEERMEQEFARWKRFGAPLTLMVWDVDDFKSINDRFGHQAGDRALRVIAQSLKARLRETDFIARFGGEEFVTLLCGTEGEEAIKVAEQMRQSVNENGFHSHGKPVPVTISCGIATFRTSDNFDSVFSRADKALYEAKRAGKNRCELR